ncbi:MAG TPA: ribonucleoside triphosphate reductase [Bacteroidales bacterium]|nr:ribonucleoside triphosphate reductase [Bacteroidales bacterium]HOU31704.1 ribonucleoside triphosphate reductase [Bacteroidales bacterium]HQH23311.1 ribonucleoside triphosphate reductase [Bacteroidales bacterium]HQJ82215.1 ribonucleoside triphosphate reductase [Bacteroidales bacterium]
MNGKLFFSQIIKRNGDVVPFNREKIENAVFKATRAIGRPDRAKANRLSADVLEKLSKLEIRELPTVELVQDQVERTLFEDGDFQLAKAYILYRKQRELARNAQELFSNIEVVDDYLGISDWRVNESANSAYSLQGLNQHISTTITSQYWLDRIYPENISSAHKQGYFHIHDLGFLSVYCVGWDLRDLLLSGFRGVNGKTQTKPARHFRTALGQIVNFFYTMQGEAAGAQAFSNFDTLLAPYIRKDNLDYKQIKQCIQEFLFNMNIPTRVGFQTPFTNITMDLHVPDFLKQEQIVWGGEIQEDVYGSFQNEITLLNKAFAEVMLEGDAAGSLFSFPIPTYNITPDFDWDNSDYDSIWEMTAKYGIPYFSNFVNSDMKPDDVRSMCCRLRLDKRELIKRGGGLFASNPLTGSVGVVTINLSKLGYEAISENNFFEKLKNLMILARESLEIKRKTIENYTEKGLYPYSKFYLRDIYKRFNCYWKNHFSTIGINGMNECCLNFLGKDIGHPESKSFAIRVMDFMRNVLEGFQEETGNIYNLEATPAESTAFRFARIDTIQYPDIITANQKAYKEGAAPYYTNSTHLPVGYSDDIYEVLSLQDDLQVKYTGGTVLHVFTGDTNMPAMSAKNLIRKITKAFHLPYITISPTFSICPSHGYIPGEHFSCPECNSETDVYSRIVGYMRPVNQWNKGKKQEFKDRKLFRPDTGNKEMEEDQGMEENQGIPEKASLIPELNKSR